MEDYNLSESEKIEFQKHLSELNKVWESNYEYFENLKVCMGIRSTQVMSILALKIINSRITE